VLRKDGGLAVILDDVTPTDGASVASYEWSLPEGVVAVAGETSGADDTRLWGFDCIALDSEGRPRVLVDQNATLQGASVILPRAVLIALLDPTHELADAETAEKLRLIEGGEPTPIGALIIAGTDQTALRHKMAASWRAAHNSGLDKKG
jgi:hypothetical protein